MRYIAVIGPKERKCHRNGDSRAVLEQWRTDWRRLIPILSIYAMWINVFPFSERKWSKRNAHSLIFTLYAMQWSTSTPFLPTLSYFIWESHPSKTDSRHLTHRLWTSNEVALSMTEWLTYSACTSYLNKVKKLFSYTYSWLNFLAIAIFAHLFNQYCRYLQHFVCNKSSYFYGALAKYNHDNNENATKFAPNFLRKPSASQLDSKFNVSSTSNAAIEREMCIDQYVCLYVIL